MKEVEDRVRQQEARRVAELEAKLRAQQEAFEKEKQIMAQQKTEMELKAMKEREEVEERYRKQKATVEQQKAALAIQRSFRKNSPKKQSRARQADRRRRSPRYDSEETDESTSVRRRRRGEVSREMMRYPPRTHEKFGLWRKIGVKLRRSETGSEEMKQLRDEMEQFKQSPNLHLHKNRINMTKQWRHSTGNCPKEQQELWAYNQLKDRVEERQS